MAPVAVNVAVSFPKARRALKRYIIVIPLNPFPFIINYCKTAVLLHLSARCRLGRSHFTCVATGFTYLPHSEGNCAENYSK